MKLVISKDKNNSELYKELLRICDEAVKHVTNVANTFVKFILDEICAAYYTWL